MLSFNFEYRPMIEALEHDIMLVEQAFKNPEFVASLKQIIGDNFTIIWATEGSAIGEDWNGNTLVRTGNLRDSLRRPDRLQVRLQGTTISFGSDASYAAFVNALYRFMGFVSGTEDRIVELLNEYVRINGKLNWSQ